MSRTRFFIKTKRLELRELTCSEVSQAYIDGLNDPAVNGLTEARHVRWTRKKVLDYVKGARSGGYYLIGIFLKEGDRHIGNIRLLNIDAVHKRAELGIMIFDRSTWGQGYGTEAILGVVQFAFSSLGLHRIQADYYSVNKASARLFKNAGFTVEGIFRDHFSFGSGYVDSVRVARIKG
ncbi:MAG: GNAT family N-acetyltransferase [Candidatus Omnitrophica bacterium]|nr:GNAT family N-acetyltransferase [Candidatus Omnitrophota bacterium]